MEDYHLDKLLFGEVMFYCKFVLRHLNQFTFALLRLISFILVLSHTKYYFKFYQFTVLVEALVFLGMNYLSLKEQI